MTVQIPIGLWLVSMGDMALLRQHILRSLTTQRQLLSRLLPHLRLHPSPARLQLPYLKYSKHPTVAHQPALVQNLPRPWPVS